MRKYSDVFIVCVWMVLILATCALMMASIDPTHRVALLVAAAAVVCVYMVCESQVKRAQAPLILRDETTIEKTKPPERAA